MSTFQDVTTKPAKPNTETITLSEEHVEARLVTFDEARALVRWDENAAELHALERQLAQRPMRPSE